MRMLFFILLWIGIISIIILMNYHPKKIIKKNIALAMFGRDE